MNAASGGFEPGSPPRAIPPVPPIPPIDAPIPPILDIPPIVPPIIPAELAWDAANLQNKCKKRGEH